MEIKLVNINNKNFKDLSLDIKENGVYSVLGNYKSALFNLIYGLDLNFTGDIKIGRKKINSNSKNKDIYNLRKDIAYLTHDDKTLFNINILEDIKYGLDKLDNNRLFELLKYFSLDEDILKKNYSDLSSGEKKKILIIKTFMGDKKIVLLDGVTNGLDSKSIENVAKLIKKEKRNRIILITSNDSNFLLSVSDNVLLLDSGLMCGNKYEIFDNEELLNKLGMDMPDVLKFRKVALNKKNIKLMYRDNINDLIKDIYRNV